MNTDTNVQDVEPVAWMRTDGFGSPVVTEELLRTYPQHRQDFETPLYTAASLAAITADAERYRLLKQHTNICVETYKGKYRCYDRYSTTVLTGWKDSHEEAIDAAVAALESQ